MIYTPVVKVQNGTRIITTFTARFIGFNPLNLFVTHAPKVFELGLAAAVLFIFVRSGA